MISVLLCGATAYYNAAWMEGFIGISAGTFAGAAFPGLGCPVYDERMHAWAVVPEGLAHIF